MNTEALTPLLDALAKVLAPRIAAAMKQEQVANPNELMTVSQIAREFGMRPSTVRNLINAGTLHRAPDIREMRVKRSVVEAYGRPSK